MKRRNKYLYFLIPVLLLILFAGSFLFLIKEDDSLTSDDKGVAEEEVKVIELEPEEEGVSDEIGTGSSEAVKDKTEEEPAAEELTETKTDVAESDSEEENKEEKDDESEKAESDSGEMNLSDEPEPDASTEEAADPVESEPGDWVATLPSAQNEEQIMVVAASGSSAVLSLHNKDADGNWKEIFSTKASIGKNGIGKSKEGDHKTPRGSYRFTMGFGIKKPASVNLPYTQVDSNCFWVDDPGSKYYNRFVSLGSVEKDWNSAESLAGSGSSYNYALAINYNEACVPGKGSAIFLHCLPTGGAGCIAVSEDAMVRILKETSPNCLLLIDSATELGSE